MKRIITCGFSENLIRKISDFAFENFLSKGADPSRLCFVFGGRRPSLFLKKELARRSGGAMISPAFFTMEDFMKKIAESEGPFSFIPDLEAAYTLYCLAKENAPGMLEGRGSFAAFLPWANEILSFINQADMEGVKDGALENIEANAEIGYDIPRSVNELLKNVNTLRRAFHASISERKMMSRGMLYLSAARRAADYDLSGYDAVVFGGVFYLHKTEEEVVRAIYGSGKGALFFQGDSSEWTVLKKLEKAFDCRISAPANRDPGINLYCGCDLHSQASIAGQVLENISSPENGVLIIPDPAALMPVLTEISPVVKELNVSLGYPVEKSSLYSLLEAVFKAQESRKEKEYYTRDYLSVILHPLAKNMKLPYDPSVTRMLVHRIEEVLTTDTGSELCGRMFLDPDEILKEEKIFAFSFESGAAAAQPGNKELKDILERFHNTFFKLWEGVRTFKDLGAAVEAFARSIEEKSFAAYYPMNSKALEMLVEAGGELAASSFGAAEMPAEEIFKILIARLRDGFVSFPGTPLKGFQVLGLLESRSLNFENVIIIDANESVLPKLKASEPLIPREVMLNLGISRIEKEEEIQKYEFFRLIKGAGNAHIIYSNSEENERSRFIEELIWEREKKDKSFKLRAANFGFRSEPPSAKRAYEKLPEILESLRNMKYTATNLSAYLDCPLRFYMSYVLNVKEKEAYTEEPGGSEIGRFIHDFLFKQLSAFEGGKPVYDKAFEERFMGSLESSFKNAFSKRMRAGAFMIGEVVAHRMRGFIEKERERNPRKILALEKTYSGLISSGGMDYTLQSRIDRLDELEDGGLLIIDYKTGGTADIRSRLGLPKDDELLSREIIRKYLGSLQLPVYLSLVRKRLKKEKLDAALYDLRAAELYVFFRDADEKAVEAKTAFYGKALEFVIGEINDASIPFAPDDSSPQKCLSCPYFLLCR